MATLTSEVSAKRTTEKFYIRQLFGELVTDPRTPRAYSDCSPKTLSGWEHDVRNGVAVPYGWFVGDTLGGAFWMHDYEDDYTWLGGYVMPAFRGREHEELCRQGSQACEQAIRHDGFKHLFAVVLAHNTAAQVWVRQCCGLTPLGIYRHWTINRGRWTDGVVFCKNYPQDQNMAWVLAERRVETVRQYKF